MESWLDPKLASHSPISLTTRRKLQTETHDIRDYAKTPMKYATSAHRPSGRGPTGTCPRNRYTRQKLLRDSTHKRFTVLFFCYDGPGAAKIDLYAWPGTNKANGIEMPSWRI